MLDIKFVRENPDLVDKSCESRQNAHRLKTTFGGNNSEIPSPQPSCRENKTVH